MRLARAGVAAAIAQNIVCDRTLLLRGALMTKNLHFHALGASRNHNGPDPLVPFLKAARKTPVTISARDVDRIDSHRLQILLSAEKQWRADDAPFQVTDMSPGFCAGLERLGLSPDHFDKDAHP